MANDKRQTRRDVTGRRPKKDPAVYRYGIKLNAEENGQFELRFAKSGLKYKARFIKAMILDREMKVVKLDKAAMDYYIRLTNFYHQFQAIGNNYNQTVRAVKARTAKEVAMFSFCTKIFDGTSKCTGAKFQIALIPH